MNFGYEETKGKQKILAHYSDAEDWELYPERMERVYVLKLAVTKWSCKEH